MISVRSERVFCKRRSVGFVLAVSVFMLLLAFAPSTQSNSSKNDSLAHIQSSSSNNSSDNLQLPPLLDNSTTLLDNSTTYSLESLISMWKIDSLMTTKSWTLIFYMGGIDGEKKNMDAALQHDIDDLKYVKSDNFINMVVLIDKTGIGDAKAFSVTSSGAELPITLTSIDPSWTNNEVNIGNPATLATWGVYCINIFPAEKYAVIIDDHGVGISGCSKNEQNNDMISPIELASALSQMKTANDGDNIDLLGLDVCTMGILEVADECRNYVDCLVSSEMDGWFVKDGGEPGTWDFATTIGVLKQAPGINCYELGDEFVTNYIAAWTAKSYSCTLSCIDLSLMSTFNQKLNTLTQHILSKWSPTLKNQIKAAILNTQSYTIDCNNLDVGHLTNKIYQYVTDSQIKADANDLQTYLAENPYTGFIRKNGHFNGTSNAVPGESNRWTDKASGLATFISKISDPDIANIKSLMQWNVKNVQNDSAWFKMLRAYYSLSIFPLGDDFIYYPVDWQVQNSGGGVSQDSTVYNVKPGSMKLYKYQSGYVSSQHYFKQGGRIIVEANLMFDSSYPTCYLIINDINSNINIYTGFVLSGGLWYYAYYDSSYHNVKSVSPGNWYQITLDINNAIGQFDIYVNGDCVKYGASYRTGSPTSVDLCNVYFQAGWGDATAATMWVDNVSVRPAGASSLMFIDHFNTDPSGRWTFYGVPTYGSISLDTPGYTSGQCTKMFKSSSAPGYVLMSKTFSYSSNNHMIAEAALKVDSATTGHYSLFCLNSGATNAVVFAMQGGASGGLFCWVSYSGGDVFNSIGMSYTSGKYYLITLDIDISNHKYDIYIDGFLVYAGAGWYVSTSSLNGIQLASKIPSGTYTLKTWVDDVLVTY